MITRKNIIHKIIDTLDEYSLGIKFKPIKILNGSKLGIDQPKDFEDRSLNRMYTDLLYPDARIKDRNKL